MGDNQDFFKIFFDCVNRFNQTLSALSILIAKALIDNQGAQFGSGSVRQNPAERQTQSKIDPKSFAALNSNVQDVSSLK